MEKIIQPLSSPEELRQEANRPEPPQTATAQVESMAPAVQETTKPSTTQIAPVQPQPRQNPSSIYPDATRGVSVHGEPPPAPIPASSEKVGDDTVASNKAKVIIALVIILGAYTAIPALLGLLGGVTALSFGFVGKGSLLTIIDVVYLLVGAGLVLRKDLARAAYVFLAIIGLLLSIYGTYQTFHISNFHGVNVISYDKAQDAQTITQDQQEITDIQNNNLAPGQHLTDAQKQQEIQQVRQGIAKTKNNEARLSGTRLSFGLIQGYLLAIIPLAFLTRPGVKAVFG